MALSAFIAGCKGTRLTDRERRFFAEAKPCGLILFKRNCESVDQIRALTGEFQDILGIADALILIDQEGGRVQRLRPPNWRNYPPARRFGALYRSDNAKGLEAARLGARLIARDLQSLGITVNCAPVLDIPVPGAHDVIGDRAYGERADEVIALGRAAADGYLEGGVLPVIKHIPGHGRAGVDSHASLPVIRCSHDEMRRTDFEPFRALNDLPLGMTAHILVPELDPDRPSSASRRMIQEMIRGEIGFDGLLMCDDLSMRALSGPMRDRAEAVLEAGCDVALHCSGAMNEMEAVASIVPPLTGDAARRFDAALRRLGPPKAFDEARAEALLGEVLAQTA